MVFVCIEIIVFSDGKFIGLVKLNKDFIIVQIFESLEYGLVFEVVSSVDLWFEEYGRDFGYFVNGKWVKFEGRKVYEIRNFFIGK